MGKIPDSPPTSKSEDMSDTRVQPSSRGSAGTMRPILPKEEQNEESVNLDVVTDARSSKRRCVSSACIPCRKRKSKCDGGTPSCSTCTAVYHTDCVYDIDSDHRRKGALKRDIETLRERNGALGIIVASIRSSSDSEVADIVQQIRADENLEAIADSLKKNVFLPRRAASHSLEGDLSDIMGKSLLSQSGEFRHFGHTSSLGLISHEEGQPVRNLVPSESWTRVTRDASLTAGDAFYAEAKRLLFEDEHSSLTTVQALALMGLREVSTGRDSSGFHLMGRCMRMAIELGLHLGSTSGEASVLSESEVEVRKITFWGCFTLDTLTEPLSSTYQT
ncbi:MAG: hypothetical protein LQ347_005275 [Umbilicaria vellea]|nr:MAG: hypothetical protein LQ347_005275 [Umbilicaria vellea]